MTIEIPLTKGMKTIIDDIDSDLAGFKWFARSGYCYYATKGKDKEYLTLHRLILSRVLGRNLERKEICDHVNGNTLDNRRVNLRVADFKQNNQNRGMRKDNTSGFKGVSWDKFKKRWKVQIAVDGKNKTVGRYDTIDKAHEAYCEAAIKYFGDFARFE